MGCTLNELSLTLASGLSGREEARNRMDAHTFDRWVANVARRFTRRAAPVAVAARTDLV